MGESEIPRFSRNDGGWRTLLGTRSSHLDCLTRHDQFQFGHYHTKDLILAYMNAPAAGDTETPLAV